MTREETQTEDALNHLTDSQQKTGQFTKSWWTSVYPHSSQMSVPKRTPTNTPIATVKPANAASNLTPFRPRTPHLDDLNDLCSLTRVCRQLYQTLNLELYRCDIKTGSPQPQTFEPPDSIFWVPWKCTTPPVLISSKPGYLTIHSALPTTRNKQLKIVILGDLNFFTFSGRMSRDVLHRLICQDPTVTPIRTSLSLSRWPSTRIS